MARDHKFSLLMGPFGALFMAIAIVVGATSAIVGEWSGDGLLMTVSLIFASALVFAACAFLASRDTAPLHRVFEVLGLLVACLFAVAPGSLGLPPGRALFLSLVGVAVGFGIGRWSAAKNGETDGETGKESQPSSGNPPSVTDTQQSETRA